MALTLPSMSIMPGTHVRPDQCSVMSAGAESLLCWLYLGITAEAFVMLMLMVLQLVVLLSNSKQQS